VISITVEDKDPKLAADLANAYIANLDRMFVRMGTSEGSRQRAFIAQQLDKTAKDLRTAEEALQRFQEKNKTIAIAVGEQARAGIEASARLKGEIQAAEVALNVMRLFATENNPEVQKQRRTIEELKRQLAQLQYGRGLDLPQVHSDIGTGKRDFSVPIASVPVIATDMLRLMREVKVQETVYTLLTQQYEQARIAEARDTPTVQILDSAVPGERNSKPKTVMNMAITGISSLFVSIMLAFFLEHVRRLKAKERGRP
jgi:uncharacterized protein involved in exopolysaccharide biosynthesis